MPGFWVLLSVTKDAHYGFSFQLVFRYLRFIRERVIVCVCDTQRWLISRLISFYKDYMHVTKRFGHIAASQLPLHYMLPLKSPYSPLAIAFRSSHEQLNAYHRITGRIIYCFLLLHVTFYLNFFAQHGILEKKFKQLVPILGALSITLVTVLAITSMASIRRWSYRVFFVFHIAIAISIVPILFLHAPPLRLYGGEAIAILTIDILLRRLNTVTAVSRITMIEHTELVGLASPIPESKISRFKAAPGQHVYLSIPSSIQFSVPLLSIHQLLFNPFTVAGVSPREILLVLRAQHGPTTTALKQLARLPSTNVSINIEGPYGASRQFPNFTAEFERILLVAGGVGATFILPFYHQITTEMGNEGFSTSKVELVWSMRSMAEANWVTDTKYANIFNGSDRVKIYVTGIESRSSVSRTAVAGHEDVSIEMEDLLRIQPDHVRGGLMRPNLKSIVDKTFHHGLEERVAILVCGPAGMARELREHVGDWIAKGRSVWWHDESFGW